MVVAASVLFDVVVLVAVVSVVDVVALELSDSDVVEVLVLVDVSLVAVVVLSDELVDVLVVVDSEVEPLVEPLSDSEAVDVDVACESYVLTPELAFVESAGIVAVLFAASRLPVSASLLVLLVAALVSACPTIGAAIPPPKTAAKLVMVV